MDEQEVTLRFGFNETDNWWSFAKGPHRETICAGLREVHTDVIRIFLFDKHAPDPRTQWQLFSDYVQSVLDTGAIPMVTFAKFAPSYTDYSNIQSFASRCSDVVWGCIEQWGGERVAEWYWCIWNEPNNRTIGGNLRFEDYQRIYEETAFKIFQCLEPHLKKRKALIGGPAVDGFNPGWRDWISRFLTEIDNKYIGFVSWHRYGDWRAVGRRGAPKGEGDYRNLLMAKLPDYQGRALSVGRLIGNRRILNVCGELNVNSDHRIHVSRRYNQTIFGAAYYVSALLHLIRGGADLEMWWTATDSTGPYGIMDDRGHPTPVFLAKKLFARHVRYGYRIRFPWVHPEKSALDIAVARDKHDNISVVLAHLSDKEETFSPSALGSAVGLERCSRLYRIDRKTGSEIISEPFEGSVTFGGYGVAVATTSTEFEVPKQGN